LLRNIQDCDALAQIATVLNKLGEAKELTARANEYRTQLKKLWSQPTGIFLNKRTDTDVFSDKISPTNFYPLLGKAASPKQAERMMQEHLLNPEEFKGQWMIPSISMKDPAFKDQQYWRGRIWGPMNFLVYLGLLNYQLPEARKVLAEKSNQLFMENIKLNGYVFENYNGITGNITDPAEGRREGDNYYHWGALLGFIAMIENGSVPDPSKPIQ
jgi:putative isomerase